MIQEPLTISRAEKADCDEIYTLYHSLIDDPYGTWNDEYPSKECVENDLAENIVYVMRDATGRIVSSIVDEQDIHEFDNLAPAASAWRTTRRGTASPAKCWRTRWIRRRNAAVRPSDSWWRRATFRRSARMRS